jgi:hypothetical protein
MRESVENSVVSEADDIGRLVTAVSAVALLSGSSSAADMRGVTATEIKIGQTMPYSGPVSAFGAPAFPSYAHE